MFTVCSRLSLTITVPRQTRSPFWIITLSWSRGFPSSRRGVVPRNSPLTVTRAALGLDRSRTPTTRTPVSGRRTAAPPASGAATDRTAFGVGRDVWTSATTLGLAPGRVLLVTADPFFPELIAKNASPAAAKTRKLTDAPLKNKVAGDARRMCCDVAGVSSRPDGESGVGMRLSFDGPELLVGARTALGTCAMSWTGCVCGRSVRSEVSNGNGDDLTSASFLRKDSTTSVVLALSGSPSE